MKGSEAGEPEAARDSAYGRDWRKRFDGGQGVARSKARVVKVLVTIEPASASRKVREVRKLIEGAARVVLTSLGLDDAELSLLLTDDEGIRELNAEYRHKDRATDVLSFPMGDEVMLGDVVISLDTAVRQASEFDVTIECELGRLLVHGILHLIGYDHTTGGWQARRMRAREEELLAALEDSGVISRG